jgi:hypothetical protein
LTRLSAASAERLRALISRKRPVSRKNTNMVTESKYTSSLPTKLP